jgi:hypothetical protein
MEGESVICSKSLPLTKMAMVTLLFACPHCKPPWKNVCVFFKVPNESNNIRLLVRQRQRQWRMLNPFGCLQIATILTQINRI